MRRALRIALVFTVLLGCSGCLLDYDNCSITYTVDAKAQTATVSIRADNVRLPDDPTGIIKDPKKHYEALTTPETGAIPRLLGRTFAGTTYSCEFPKYENLPGKASFTGSDASFLPSLLVALEPWDYTISRTGNRLSFVFQPTKASTEEGKMPWDTFSLQAKCKIVAHNADSVDKKTGQLTWKLDRGKRKAEVSCVIEVQEPSYSGAP